MVNFFLSCFNRSAFPEIILGYAGFPGMEHLGDRGSSFYRTNALSVPNQQYTGTTYLPLTSKY